MIKIVELGHQALEQMEGGNITEHTIKNWLLSLINQQASIREYGGLKLAREAQNKQINRFAKLILERLSK